MKEVFHTSDQAATEFTQRDHSTTRSIWFAQTYILRKDLRLFCGVCYQWHVMCVALRWPVTPQAKLKIINQKIKPLTSPVATGKLCWA